MEINFILVASGSVTTPRLNHVVFAREAERAKTEAQDVVRTLAKAGYFAFDLFEIDGETQTRIESYRVEIPEPVVTVKAGR